MPHEASDFEPANRQGPSFQEVKDKFDQHAGRSSRQTQSPLPSASRQQTTFGTNSQAHESRPHEDALPLEIVCTNKDGVLVFCNDGTGSARNWLAPVCAKAPYMIPEVLAEYLGSTGEFIFGTFGDMRPSYPDDFAVKFRLPVKTSDEAEKVIFDLKTEFDGGGQRMENSELAALYTLLQIKAVLAKLKVLIIVTDESPYPTAELNDAKKLGIKAHGDVPTKRIFEELKSQGWIVFIIQKPYSDSSNFEDAYSREVSSNWEMYVGKENVIKLRDRDRVTDIVFGVLAWINRKLDYFYEDLLGRQVDETGRPEIEKLIPVYESLRQLHGKEIQDKYPCPGWSDGGLGHGVKSQSLM